jgi:hypothetical protein
MRCLTLIIILLYSTKRRSSSHGTLPAMLNLSIIGRVNHQFTSITDVLSNFFRYERV